MTLTEHTHPNGVVYLTAPTIPVAHGFSTRFGGVSEGHLAALNLGDQHRGDTPEHLRENYRRFGEAVGFDPGRMVFTHQVHGNAVRTVTSADVHTLTQPVPYEADGVVTAEIGLALVCFTADCVPVLLCDESAGVAAAVHCGWRSSVSDILKNTLDAMAALGAAPGRVAAAIGPSIGFCCFEVGPEVIGAAEDYLGGDTAGLVRPGKAPGKFYLDLRGANARRLVQLGLAPEKIAVSGECTMCRPDKYWSHRVTGQKRGSMASAIMIK